MMASVVKLNPRRISSQLVKDAAAVIRKGGVILYPTDTIYGLGCDAFNERALRRIYQLKHRLETSPALVLVNSIAMLDSLVADVPPVALRLMKKFWPGPLTMIFRARGKMNSFIVSPDGKIGVRIPNNRFCLRLVETCETPIVSTSANISGRHALGNIRALSEMFSDSTDLVIDAGDLDSILPSTVVDVSDGKLVVVREGMISRRRVERFLKSCA